jgi:Mn-dependent DtxR family transcriptional regulator
MLDNKYFEPMFKGTNFGSTEYASLITEGLLKVATYYANGATMDRILIDNGLMTRTNKKKIRKLTQKGATYLYRLIGQHRLFELYLEEK